MQLQTEHKPTVNNEQHKQIAIHNFGWQLMASLLLIKCRIPFWCVKIKRDRNSSRFVYQLAALHNIQEIQLGTIIIYMKRLSLFISQSIKFRLWIYSICETDSINCYKQIPHKMTLESYAFIEDETFPATAITSQYTRQATEIRQWTMNTYSYDYWFL